jgi:hypothetical protein
MPAGYWFVQPYRIGGAAEAEQRCADCGEVCTRVEQIKRTNTDPNVRLRVHVPSHATAEERDRLKALGVEPI